MKKITLVPIGGLGNRMLAVSSFISYCSKNNYFLEIQWGKDNGLACSFSDLFQPFSVENVELKEISGTGKFIWDFPRKQNLWLSYFFQSFLFDKRIYSKAYLDTAEGKKPAGVTSIDVFDKKTHNSKSVYVAACRDLFSENTLHLPPVTDLINSLIEEITAAFSPRTIGLHIRRTDHIHSIKNNPTELYIQKMNEELDKNPDTSFFVASDSIEEKQRLIEIYNEKIITSMQEVRRDSAEGIQYALAEIYALSRTEKIYGSRHSTFSIVASKLSQKENCLF